MQLCLVHSADMFYILTQISWQLFVVGLLIVSTECMVAWCATEEFNLYDQPCSAALECLELVVAGGCRPVGHTETALIMPSNTCSRPLECIQSRSHIFNSSPKSDSQHLDCLYICSGIRCMPAHMQVLLSILFLPYLPSSSSVAPGLATNTGSEGLQPSSCHSFVCFVLVSSLMSYYEGGRLK